MIELAIAIINIRIAPSKKLQYESGILPEADTCDAGHMPQIASNREMKATNVLPRPSQ